MLRRLLPLLPLGCSSPSTKPVDTAAGHLPGLLLGPEVRCERPLPGVQYAEVGAELGLQGHPDPTAIHHHGGGAAVVDLDDDTDLDAVLSFPVGPPVLYRNTGSTFVAETLPAPAEVFAVSAYDIDTDGDIDLLAAGYKQDSVLLRNHGDGTFDVEPLPGAGPAAQRVRELAPADLDGDGQAEIYAMANSGSDDPLPRADHLLRLGPDGWEVDDDALPLEAVAGRGFDVHRADYDLDGDLDLYVTNDVGNEYAPNALFENRDGQVILRDDCACDLQHFGMGTHAADVDGDLRLDLYLTAVAHGVLLHQQPDGTFVDVSRAWKADPITDETGMGWGAVFLDFDNDGLQDILHAQGDRWQDLSGAGIVYEAPIDLLHQSADGTFESVGPSMGLATEGSHRATVATDFNGDGVLDLLVTDVVAPPKLYLSEGCTAAGWLEVAAPPGTRVELTAGGRDQLHEVTHESSYAASGPAVAHVGLADAQVVDKLTITTPDGRVLEATDLPARRRVTVAP